MGIAKAQFNKSQSQSGRGVVLTLTGEPVDTEEFHVSIPVRPGGSPDTFLLHDIADDRSSQSQSGRGVVLTNWDENSIPTFSVSIPVRPGGSPDRFELKTLSDDCRGLNPSPAGG